MQDKVYEIKNLVSLKCIEASRRLHNMSAANDSVDSCENLQKQEHASLLNSILDEILDNKMTVEERVEILSRRITAEKEFPLRDRLVQNEMEKYKNSEPFKQQIEDMLEERIIETMPDRIEEAVT